MYNINLLRGSDFRPGDRFGFSDKHSCYCDLFAHTVSEEIESHGLNCNLQPLVIKGKQ